MSTLDCVTYVDLASPDEYFRIQITATNDKGESKGLPYLSPLFSKKNNAIEVSKHGDIYLYETNNIVNRFSKFLNTSNVLISFRFIIIFNRF